MAPDNAEALNRFLDDLAHGAGVPDDDLDPDLIATVRWFGDFGAEPRPDAAFRTRLEHDLMNQIALSPATGVPGTGTKPLFPSGTARRLRLLPQLPSQLRRELWTPARIAAVLLLVVLGLAYLVQGPLRPDPDGPLKIPAAVGPDATPTAVGTTPTPTPLSNVVPPTVTPPNVEVSATAIPVSNVTHPLTGVWQWQYTTGVSTFGIFDDDGSYVEYRADAGVGIGGWRPTGERSAELVVVYQLPAEPLNRGEIFSPDYVPTGPAFQPGIVVQRFAIEVDPSGSGLIATGTAEQWDATGNMTEVVDVGTQFAARVGSAEPSQPQTNGGAAIVVVQVFAEDGMTPIGGTCVELTGPTTLQMCDDSDGDYDPTLGIIEVDEVPAGDYAIAVTPPEGLVPVNLPTDLAVQPGDVATLAVTLQPIGSTSADATATTPPLPMPTSTPVS